MLGGYIIGPCLKLLNGVVGCCARRLTARPKTRPLVPDWRITVTMSVSANKLMKSPTRVRLGTIHKKPCSSIPILQSENDRLPIALCTSVQRVWNSRKKSRLGSGHGSVVASSGSAWCRSSDVSASQTNEWPSVNSETRSISAGIA